MLNTQNRAFLLVALTSLLAACSNVPKSTTADIPLVHASLAYSLSAEEDVAISIPNLNSSFSQGQSIQIMLEGIDYEATKLYTSATGNDCIRFQATLSATQSKNEDTKDKLTVCKRDGAWSVLSPLVASAQSRGE
ncbi:hypothetical protein NQT74_14000 [Alteromonas stellipolaris]|jgi:hypothetical protein|uniref:hypothetical protein n=1 Tax=Alteromonas stellipolaris TaxID=233316 RepID=UPI0021191F09|nr:hypothetical protein [Alteromonas stellipolaris]MCQ8849699.1 hypothetical protein [Alteromonas stellipolaris]